MLTDSELMSLLVEAGGDWKENGRWICRGSMTGRGLRLHQTRSYDGDFRFDGNGAITHAHPRDAIRAYLESVFECG